MEIFLFASGRIIHKKSLRRKQEQQQRNFPGNFDFVLSSTMANNFSIGENPSVLIYSHFILNFKFFKKKWAKSMSFEGK